MIEYDVGEVAISPIIEIKHICFFSSDFIPYPSPGDHVGCKRKGTSNVISAWFANDADVWWKVVVQSSVKYTGKHIEGVICESAANIKKLEVKSNRRCLIENISCVPNRLDKRPWIACTRSDMKADSNNVQAKVFGKTQEHLCIFKARTEFGTQAAEASGIVGQNTQHKFCTREECLDFIEFVDVVKSHLFDTFLSSISDVRLCFAWLSIDNAARINSQFQDSLNFGLGGTIKPGTKVGQEAEDFIVGVALDSWERSDRISRVSNPGPTVEWLDPAQVKFPTQMLPVYLA